MAVGFKRYARLFGRTTRDSFDWNGVRAGADNVRTAWQAVRAPNRALPAIDVHAALDRAYHAELWQTAWDARVYGVATACVLALWIGVLLWTGDQTPVLAAVAPPLLAIGFAIRALASAAANWRLRSESKRGVMAFLNNDGRIWPPLPPRP